MACKDDCVPSEEVSNEPAVLSDFEIKTLLGKGSFGKVYMVRKTRGVDKDTYYAMKIMCKSRLSVMDLLAAKTERDFLAQISHPFLLKLYYSFQSPEKIFYVTDFIRGGDLFTRLIRDGYLTEHMTEFYSSEVVLGVSHLHSLGIIYRDLKSENVMVRDDGHVCLIDFGMAKETSQSDSTCGTLEYMSPEMVLGATYTKTTDWWSLGILIFELLMGDYPFKGPTRNDVMLAIIRDPIAGLEYLGIEAESIINRFCSKDPEERLGAGENGLRDIQSHEFFRFVEWDKLFRKEVQPPYIPKLQGIDDTSCFENPFTSNLTDSSEEEVSEELNMHLKGFEYSAPLDVFS